MPRPNLLHCQNCGKQLSGRMVRWCSPTCKAAGWEKQHPDAVRLRVAAFRARQRAGLPPPTPLPERVIELEVENMRLRAALAKGPVE